MPDALPLDDAPMGGEPVVEVVRGCEKDASQLAKFEEMIDDYDIDQKNPNADPRWYWNAIARDTVAFACGRVASGDQIEVEHVHDRSEIDICKLLATEASEILEGMHIGRGDEGDHYWSAFHAPVFVDEFTDAAEVPAEPTIALLKQMCGDAIWPGLNFEIKPMKEELDREMADMDPSEDPNRTEDQRSAYSRLNEWFALHSEELSAPYYFYPMWVGCGDEDNSPPVYPHFIVAVRKGTGSLVGLSSATVWT